MHIEFVPDFCAGSDQSRLSDPVSYRVGGRACDIARGVYEELLHVDSVSEMAFEGLSLLLVAETLREISRESKAPRWLQRVRERLHEEFMAVPSVREIATEAGVHPTYLSAAFQQHFGMNVGEFVHRRRIEVARDSLTHSDQPLGDMALHLGFADQSHFGRVFKQQTGFSPREYRRLFAGSSNRIPKS